MAEDWQAGGFGLYIHWPFCEAKCPYCDFNSHVAREIDQKRWLRAYLSEIERYGAMLSGRVLNTVYFGGGTPSLMDPEVVAGVLDRVRRTWPAANDLEVTLEANPGSVEAGRFRAYAEAGVSRVSVGVQALNDVGLRRLGRIHSAAEARQAIDIANDNFDRISFDLIYARQDQSVEAWRAELTEALSMAVDHLSLYQLTIEPGTAFGDRYRRGGLRGLPDEDRATEMFLATQEISGAAGFSAYEVSSFAKPGAESRHNLIYWRYGDYAGIGPGAHGRVTRAGGKYATEAWAQPEKWLTEAEGGRGDKSASLLSGTEQAEEYVIMGLRIAEGVDRGRFRAMSGRDLREATLRHLSDLGMIDFDDRRVAATAQGRLVLNSVIAELLAD